MLKSLLKNLLHIWQRARETFWLFVGYLMSQAAIQVMNFVTGILILRSMAKDEYAAYTIMNTLIPAMLLLTDTGIGTGLFSIGRVVWEDNEKMGRLVNTGMKLRRQFALVSFLLVGPFLAWMLFRNNVSIPSIILLIAISLVSVSSQLAGAVVRTVLQLRQQFKIMIQAGLATTLLRLTLIAGIVALFHISAVLALAATTLSIMIETFVTIWAVKPQIAWTAPIDAEYQATILGLVKRTLPLTVYFCVSGQLSVWLLGIFGSVHQVADIGAAGRLGMIFNTITSSFSAIMVTKFAKANGRRRLYLHAFLIMSCLTIVLSSVVVFAWFVPQPFIWLLGPKYSNLSDLIWLVVLSTGANALAGSIFGLNTCKGWIPPAIVTIPTEIITQVILISCLDVSKTKNVLILGCLSAIPVGMINAYILIRNLRNEPE